MRAISLTQPWSSLIAVGSKKIETRSWQTSYRGKLAIHASKGFPGEAKRFCESRVVCEALGWPLLPNPLTQESLDESARIIKSLPLGAVIATCRLVACKFITSAMSLLAWPGEHELRQTILPPPEPELHFGNYECGRYAWILDDVKPLATPIPYKGALSLWEFPDELLPPQS